MSSLDIDLGEDFNSEILTRGSEEVRETIYLDHYAHDLKKEINKAVQH